MPTVQPASTATRCCRPLPAILTIVILVGAGAEAGTTQSNNQSSGTQSTQQSATTAYGTRTPTPPVGGAGAQQNATSTQALKEKFDAAARQPSPRSGLSGTWDGAQRNTQPRVEANQAPAARRGGLSGAFDAAKVRQTEATEGGGQGGTTGTGGNAGGQGGAASAGFGSQRNTPAPGPRPGR